MVAKEEPASWKEVIPKRSASRPARRTRRLMTASAASPVRAGLTASDGAFHERLRVFPQQAGGPAAVRAHDGSPRRVGGVARNSGCREGGVVCQGGVAAGMRQVDRIVRRNRVQAGVHRHSVHAGPGSFRPLFLVPAAPEDPGAGVGSACGSGNLADDFFPVRGGGKIQDFPGAAQVEKMAVALDEARQGQASVQFDDLGFRADIGIDVGIAAHCFDSVTVDRNRFGFADHGIHRDHLAAPEHQIGRFRHRFPATTGSLKNYSHHGQEQPRVHHLPLLAFMEQIVKFNIINKLRKTYLT